jgi:hypothetical protein
MHDLLEDLTVGLNLVLLSDDLPCAEESPPSVALYRPAPYLPSFKSMVTIKDNYQAITTLLIVHTSSFTFTGFVRQKLTC